MKISDNGAGGLKHSWSTATSQTTPKPSLLSGRVADIIERHIVREGMKQGDKLPSGRELAELIDVSRTVIRDAISILGQRGLLEARPGSGVYVADGSSQAVRDVLGQMLRRDAISFDELAEVRRLLEVHSAVVAATRATPIHIDTMSMLISKMKNARGALAFVEADVEFHEVLGRASGNGVLIAFLESLRPFLVQGMLAGTRLEGAREVALNDHAAILDAIRNHHESQVRTLMTDHLERSSQEWLDAGRATSNGVFAQ